MTRGLVSVGQFTDARRGSTCSASASTGRYSPIEPLSDVDFAVDPPEASPERAIEPGDGATWQAGARVSPLLERALVFNLSGARVLDPKHARELLDLWLETEFEDGRHARRVAKIESAQG